MIRSETGTPSRARISHVGAPCDFHALERFGYSEQLLANPLTFRFVYVRGSEGGQMQRSSYTIRQLTKELGVSARTLRFYEDEGLVKPQRRGYTRIFSEADRARILVVLRGRRLGFTLDEMSQMLRNYDLKDSETRDQMLYARQKFVERLERLREKSKDIDESIKQITGCIAEIDGALEGGPKKPWHTFFADVVATAGRGDNPTDRIRAPSWPKH